MLQKKRFAAARGTLRTVGDLTATGMVAIESLLIDIL
jgi:hypothetical protein